MPEYYPTDVGVPLQASRSDLTAFAWATNGITANSILPDDGAHLLRVSFSEACIVRLLDEMPLSTEDDAIASKGRVAEHFAYRVEDSAFCRQQSEAWKNVFGLIQHHQFVTGWACMDVLTAAIPLFPVIKRLPLNHRINTGIC